MRDEGEASGECGPVPTTGAGERGKSDPESQLAASLSKFYDTLRRCLPQSAGH